MPPALGIELPVHPMGHHRALSSMASVFIFMTASIVLFFAFIYLLDRSVDYEDRWNEVQQWEETVRVVRWEWVLAGVLMAGSFGVGIAGGICAARVTRYPLAVLASIMLLVSTIIIVWDYSWRDLWDEGFGDVLFLLVLAVLGLVLLALSRPAFEARERAIASGPGAPGPDNYGWSPVGRGTMPPSVGGGKGGAP